MNRVEITAFIKNNAYTSNGRLRPNYLDKHPSIKTVIYDALPFMPTSAYQSDYIKAYISELDTTNNIVLELYDTKIKPKQIAKKTKIDDEVVYATLKYHNIIKGFSLNYVSSEQKVVDLYDSGLSIYDIAKRVGTSVSPVRRILKENNINMRLTKMIIDEEAVLLEYVTNKNTIAYISKLFDCSVTVINKILIENEVLKNNHLLDASVMNEAILEYLSGVTGTYVALKYNVSTTAIYKEMEQRGMTRRSSTYYSDTDIELIIKDILDKHNVHYVKNDREQIGPKELDFYLPEYNLAIECNGLYWHSSHNMTSVDCHYQKFKMCDDKNIQLLQFWCNDIKQKYNIVESIIKNKIGLSNRVFARKCEVKDVDGTMTRQFLVNNHIQGYATSSINKGLYYNDELVMIMTVSKSRFDKGSYELIRVATKLGLVVVGGFSRLLVNIRRCVNSAILTYCNLMYGNGNAYLKNGFRYIEDTSVGYFYHNTTNIIISRYKLQSKKFKDSIEYDYNINEKDNMLNAGYYMCNDAGNRKYIFE